MNVPRYILILFALLALAGSFGTRTARATEKICDMVIEPVWAEAESLVERLRRDAFADAFDVYIRDLNRNRANFDEWRTRAERWAAENCRPVEALLARHEAEVEAHNRACPSTVPDQATADRCNANAARLNTQVDRVNAAIKRVAAAWEKSNDEFWPILRAQERASERARSVLDSKNTEDAFRLFTSLREREVKSRSKTSCQTMAELYDALARRLNYDGTTFAAILERTFATRSNPLLQKRFPMFDEATHGDFAFSGSGFKREFFRSETRDHIRHFTFYFVQGTRMGTAIPMAVSFYEDQLQNQPQDFRLTRAALRIAESFAHSPRGIGDVIRRDICE